MKYLDLNTIRFIFIVIVFTTGTASSKTQFRYEDMQVFNLTLEDGLSQATVNAILRDHYGYMWFGTYDGLNRYDGYDFRVFRHLDTDPNSLSNNNIYCLLETSGGKLWVGTSGGGISVFDFHSETFTTIYPDRPDRHPGSKTVYFLTEAPDHSIWAATAEGLYQIDQDKLTVTTSFHHNPLDENSLSSSLVTGLYFDESGNLWIAPDAGGLNLYLPESGSFKKYLPPELKTSEEQRLILSVICPAGDNEIWVGSHGSGLFKFDLTERILKYQPLIRDISSFFWREGISGLLPDRDGCLWISAMPDGLLRMQDGKTHSFEPSILNKTSRVQWGVLSFYQDDTGAIWVGTNGYGIFHITRLAEKFRALRQNPGEPYGLSMASIRALYQDHRGILWVGGYGSLNQIDLKTGSVKSIEYKGGLDNPSPYINNPNIYTVVPDAEQPKKVLWVGTEGSGFCKYYFDTGRYTYFPFSNYPVTGDTLAGGAAFRIVQDRSQRLWIATVSALNRFDKKTGHFVHYYHDPANVRSLMSGRYKALFIDRQNTLWIGSDRSGFARMDDESGVFTRFNHSDDEPLSIGADGIQCFFEDSQNRFWIGTNGGGLNLMNRDKGTFIRITTADGLPNDVVYGILEDKTGSLWLSTNLGLCKFNPELKTFDHYNVDDGLQSNEFNNGAYYQSASGQMFFGGIKGVSYFYPDSIVTNPYIPSVAITGFRIFNNPILIGDKHNGRKLLTNPIYLADKIVLSYKDYAISFDFAALNFIVPEKNHYAYMLEGFDKSWNYCGHRRYANYTNLPPGKYTFRVKASNNDGLWNEAGTFINLIITPPFWQTWWFRLLAVAFILTAAMSWSRWKMSDLKKKQQILERQVAKRTSELTEVNQNLSTEIDIRKRMEGELRESNTELQRALTEVKTLSGLLPICSSCKKIRDDQGYWTQVETYITERSGVEFSHGICPDCLQKLYPDFYAKRQQKQKEAGREKPSKSE